VGFEVGLVETWKGFMGVLGLKLGEQIFILVFSIFKMANTSAISSVCRLKLNLNYIWSILQMLRLNIYLVVFKQVMPSFLSTQFDSVYLYVE